MSEHTSKYRGSYVLETNGEDGYQARFRVKWADGNYILNDDKKPAEFGAAWAAHEAANSNPTPSKHFKPA